jgi:hypothetical protein
VKRAFVLSAAVFLAAICFGIGCAVGSSHARETLRKELVDEEFSWTYQTLLEPTLQPQLREYLKAKLYYYSVFTSPEYLRRFPLADQGPISAEILAGARPAPTHADDPAEYYGWFKVKYAEGTK